jgi:hypothetical protein
VLFLYRVDWRNMVMLLVFENDLLAAESTAFGTLVELKHHSMTLFS